MAEHTYLGNYPDERQDDWTAECQGVTHDANHWFITQKNGVWRVPVGKNLNDHLKDGVDGVTNPTQNISNMPVDIHEATYPILVEE